LSGGSGHGDSSLVREIGPGPPDTGTVLLSQGYMGAFHYHDYQFGQGNHPRDSSDQRYHVQWSGQ